MADPPVTVDDEDHLYRRVFPYHIVDRRVSTAAFKDRRKKPLNKFSTDLARLTTPEECLARSELPGLRLISFLA